MKPPQNSNIAKPPINPHFIIYRKTLFLGDYLN